MSSVARRRRGFVAVVGAAAIMLTMALPASAKVIGRERFSGSYEFSYVYCGPIVDVTVEFGGLYQIRVGSGPDASAFFAHSNWWFRETHVRRSDGKTVMISGNGNLIETKATRVGGSIFIVTGKAAGQTFTVRDADGRVILRDRGVIVQTVLLDTGGDDEPGGTPLEILDVSFRGKFPSRVVDLCTVWAA